MKGFARYTIVAALIAVGAAAHFSGLTSMLSLQGLAAMRDQFQALAQSNPVSAAVAFTLAYVAVAALASPASAILSLLAGVLFGRWLGAALVLAAATTGALIVFLIARSTFGEALRRRAGPLYERIAINAHENTVSYLLFLRLVPLFPFFLVNIAAALFNIDARKFVLATLLGIAPATFVYVNFGSEIGTISSLHDILSPSLVIAFGGLGLLALIPALYRNLRAHAPASSAKD